jgi:hypothetical protein
LAQPLIKPGNGVTTPKIDDLSDRPSLHLSSLTGQMSFISDKVYKLVQSKETVTSALAASPTTAVESVAEKLYKTSKRESSKAKVGQQEPTPADLDRAAQCGKFTSRPSDLFLQVPLTNNAHFDPITHGLK